MMPAELKQITEIGATVIVACILGDKSKTEQQHIDALAKTFIALYNDGCQHGFKKASLAVLTNLKEIVDEQTKLYKSGISDQISERTGVKDSTGD